MKQRRSRSRPVRWYSGRRPAAFCAIALAAGPVAPRPAGLSAQSAETTCRVVADGAVVKVGAHVSYRTPDLDSGWGLEVRRSDGDAPECSGRSLLEGLGGVRTVGPATGGRSFEPGYLVADWNDSGAYIPAQGAGLALPLAVGVVSAGALSMESSRTLLLVFESGALVTNLAHLMGGGGDTAAGASVSVATAEGRSAPRTETDALRLAEMAVFSAVLFDATGDAVLELRCGKPLPILMQVPADLSYRVAEALRGEEAELLMVGCEEPFEVY